MSIEAALVDHITGDSTITDLISTRFYPLKYPEKKVGEVQVWPVLCYVIDDTYDIVTLEGPTGKARMRVTFDSYGERLSDCIAVTEAVRRSLNGFAGVLDDGYNVYSCKRDSESTFTRDPKDASGNWAYSKSITFAIGYSYTL